MGQTRKKVNSDETITVALNKADETLNNVAPADIAITSDTAAKVVSVNTDWNSAMGDIDSALYAQTSSTADSDASKLIAKMFISHFIQAFNNGVDRGYFTKQQRTFFHLDVNSDSVPTIDSEADIKLWGGRIVNGDALRVAAGGNPMSNPSTIEVSDALKDYTINNNTQANNITSYKNALEKLDGLRTAAMAVILKVWDESEAFWNHLPPPTKRAKCRTWGVRYVSDQIITINLTFEDSITNLAIDKTSTFLLEGNTTHLGNPQGFVEIKTTVADEATLTTNAPGYAPVKTLIPFETDVYEYTMTIKMAAVPAAQPAKTVVENPVV